jgi:sulfate adenylyltransferase subunit 2
MDVWQYIESEGIGMPSLHFSHQRNVVDRDGVLLAESEFNRLLPSDAWEERTVRFRTIGDVTCTGATESTAATLDEIIAEVAAARVTERGGRSDDKRSEAAMEDRKRVGYF